MSASKPGQLRDDELAYVDGRGSRLAVSRAAVWRRMEADAAAERTELRITPAGPGEPAGLGAYRDNEAQKWLLKHPKGPVVIGGVGSGSHQKGDTVDVDRGLAWIVRNAARYGITRPLLAKGEPWHLVLTKSLDQLGLDPVDAPATRKEWAMPNARLVRYKDSGFIGLWNTDTPGEAPQHVPDLGEVKQLESLTGPIVEFDDEGAFNIMRGRYGLTLSGLDEMQRAVAALEVAGIDARALAEAVVDEQYRRLER